MRGIQIVRVGKKKFGNEVTMFTNIGVALWETDD